MDIFKLREICNSLDASDFFKEPKDSILSGFSGEKLCRALQTFTANVVDKNNVYLEIGVFQGLTLLSNANANKDIKCIGIDNFSLFNEGGKNKEIVLKRKEELGLNNVELLDMDFEDALDNLNNYLEPNQKISVFFIDGAHDYRSQFISLLKIKSYLADDCIIVIDDANYPHVRQATKDFLSTNKNFKLLCEAYTKAHPSNLSDEEKNESIKGWWNGINIIVKDKDNKLNYSLPKIDKYNRDFHFLTHDFLRTKYVEINFELIKEAQKFIIGNEKDSEIVQSMKDMLIKHNLKYPERYLHQNTYSENLPVFKCNSLRD